MDTAGSNHGSDRYGLVWGNVLGAGWEAAPIDSEGAAEEFSVAVADSAALGERVKLLQEELAAALSEQTGRTLFVLTIVTVLALPINLLAGLFGMNVGGIPFAEDPGGFWTVVATLVAFTAAVGYLALRKFRD